MLRKRFFCGGPWLALSWVIGAAMGVAQPATPAGRAPAPTVFGWRGDGSATYPNAGFPTEWDDTKNMRWRVKVGSAYSSPVIAADSVLVTSEPANIVCLKLSDGMVRWKASMSAADAPAEFKERAAAHERDASSCGYAAPTPVCDGDDACFVFGTGLIACYSLTGNRKWVQYLEPGVQTYGHSSSPLLIGRTLLVNLNHLTALDADSGRILWECAEAGQTYGTPAVMKVGEMQIVVTPLGVVVRASDGRVLAKNIAPDLGGAEYGISPAAAGDIVYLGDRTLTAVKLSADGESVLLVLDRAGKYRRAGAGGDARQRHSGLRRTYSGGHA